MSGGKRSRHRDELVSGPGCVTAWHPVIPKERNRCNIKRCDEACGRDNNLFQFKNREVAFQIVF